MADLILTGPKIDVLRESIWHAMQRSDIPDTDRQHMHDLYEQLTGDMLLANRFEDTTDELRFCLRVAERHAQRAYELLFRRDAPKRSMWFRMLTGRAQSILMSLYVQEVNRKQERV